LLKKYIAIDGPAGAGKSTVAKAVAKELGYLYIDTGAMYRAIAYLAWRGGVAMEDEKALGALAAGAHINMYVKNGMYHVICNGEDVSEAIRLPQLSQMASDVSAVPAVRQELVRQQQLLAGDGRVVLDGRDIGTKVLPYADCKIFLTASLDVRAERRFGELKEKGRDVSLKEVKEEMAKRDYQDSHRVHSPLCQAADAILVDSSNMGLNEVINLILRLAGRE